MPWRLSHVDDRRDALAGPGISFGKAINLGTKVVFAKDTELRESSGTIIRFKPGSEFALEQDLNGEVAVCYGEIAVYGIGVLGAKYRTSCYMRSRRTLSDVHVKNISQNTDKFSSYRGTTDITEFDENGEEFTIVTVESGSWITLEADQTKPPRQRYKVTGTGTISSADYSSFIADFGPPKYPVRL